ncbi:MAG: hypothetical protein MJZ19_02930 [Paludibacteraceae bacterium]|nr:hypothetical protein [Paludibacteraceae bacterium]
MKSLIKFITAFIVMLSVAAPSFTQKKTFDGKKIKEVKEWKVEGSKRYLVEVSKFDANGKKTEEIKYNSDGSQKERVTFEYNAEGKCVSELKYDEYNKLDKKTVTEYNAQGKRIKETSYNASGKLKSIKEIEYITE